MLLDEILLLVSGGIKKMQGLVAWEKLIDGQRQRPGPYTQIGLSSGWHLSLRTASGHGLSGVGTLNEELVTATTLLQ